jgi:CRISPR type IV-associated protein Csf2
MNDLIERVELIGEGKNITVVTQTIGKEGSSSTCRKKPFVHANADKQMVTTEVPIFSDNALRSILRKRTAWYLYDFFSGEKLDYETMMILSQGGGGVTKESGQIVERLRAIENHKKGNVVVSIWGGSLNGVISRGKAVIHEMVPVCFETVKSGTLPKSYTLEEYGTLFARNLVVSEQRVRGNLFTDPEMLDKLSEEGVAKMNEVDVAAVKSRAVRKANKKSDAGKPGDSPATNGGDSATEDQSADPKTQSRQMIFSHEGIAPGTTFYHRMIFYNITEVELGSIVAALKKFSEFPYIGGLVGTGHGQMQLSYDVFTRNKGKRDQYGTINIDGDGDFSASGHLNARLEDFDNYLKGLKLGDISAGLI